jgi:hypothetical protein
VSRKLRIGILPATADVLEAGNRKKIYSRHSSTATLIFALVEAIGLDAAKNFDMAQTDGKPFKPGFPR